MDGALIGFSFLSLCHPTLTFFLCPFSALTSVYFCNFYFLPALDLVSFYFFTLETFPTHPPTHPLPPTVPHRPTHLSYILKLQWWCLSITGLSVLHNPVTVSMAELCGPARGRGVEVGYIITTCVCVCLCVRRRFHVLIDAMEPARTVGFRDREPARTVGFRDREPARTVGFLKWEPVRTENGRPDRAGRGRGAGGKGRARSGREFEKTGFGRTSGQTGQGRAGSGRAGQGGRGQGRAGRAGGQGAGYCGQGRGTHGGLHSGLRPRAPTSIFELKVVSSPSTYPPINLKCVTLIPTHLPALPPTYLPTNTLRRYLPNLTYMATPTYMVAIAIDPQ
jgi:hypothetical protein